MAWSLSLVSRSLSSVIGPQSETGLQTSRALLPYSPGHKQEPPPPPSLHLAIKASSQSAARSKQVQCHSWKQPIWGVGWRMGICDILELKDISPERTPQHLISSRSGLCSPEGRWEIKAHLAVHPWALITCRVTGPRADPAPLPCILVALVSTFDLSTPQASNWKGAGQQTWEPRDLVWPRQPKSVNHPFLSC